MPNVNFNAGFEPDGENLSALGFHPADEVEEEELEEELEDETEAEDEEDDEEVEDFDLNEDTDTELVKPALGGAISGQVIAAASDEDNEAADEPADAEAMADEDEGEELIEETDEDDDEEGEENMGDDCVIISKSKIILAQRLLENIKKSADGLISLFSGELDGDEDRISIGEISDGLIDDEDEGGKVIEGVFNGENMIGPDGKEYSVPANYASKSKLVEGDMLKLTITDRGTFIYKQTKPVERKRLIGKLEKDSNGNYLVKAEHKKFRVITASITYYKGIPGDKVVILIPIAGDSSWAAVDNVIKSK